MFGEHRVRSRLRLLRKGCLGTELNSERQRNACGAKLFCAVFGESVRPADLNHARHRRVTEYVGEADSVLGQAWLPELRGATRILGRHFYPPE